MSQETLIELQIYEIMKITNGNVKWEFCVLSNCVHKTSFHTVK